MITRRFDSTDLVRQKRELGSAVPMDTQLIQGADMDVWHHAEHFNNCDSR